MKHEPFEIPQKILNEWRDIGIKASKKTKSIKKNYISKNIIIEDTIYTKIEKVKYE